MLNIRVIERTADNGGVEEKEIYELAEEDVDKYRLLGRAVGINMNHCVILGLNHKKNFWYRVYGYRIVQDDEAGKIMLESVKNIKPEIKSYLAVCFYERFEDKKISFIPKRLDIFGRPELNNFPVNIAFGTVCLAGNDTRELEVAGYAPDFSTFIEEEIEQRMSYYNNLDDTRRYRVEIIYNVRDKSYIGKKYCGDKIAGMASGSEWNMFFGHLTILGVGVNMDIVS